MVQWKQVNVLSMEGQEKKNQENEKVYCNYGSLWSNRAEESEPGVL